MKPILLALALAAGCAALYPTPPSPFPWDGYPLDNFAKVDDNLYRSSQPNAQQLADLHDKFGVSHVFKLDSNFEGEDVATPGVVIHHRALSVLTATWAQVQRVEDEIDATCKGATVCLVHCVLGRDRTGTVVALHQLRRGVAVDAAYKALMRHGFHPYRALWRIWTRAAAWSH